MKRSRRTYAPRLPAAERRTQILDAALDLIDRDGFSAVTMEAVAAEVGVAKPVIYGVFANRGDLLWALLDREERGVLTELARLLPSPPWDGTPEDQMVASIVAVLESIIEDPRPWRVILEPAIGETADIVAEHVGRGRQWVLERITDVLGWSLTQRGVEPDAVDLELAARSVLVLSENAARLVLNDPENFPPDRVGNFARLVVGAFPRGAV